MVTIVREIAISVDGSPIPWRLSSSTTVDGIEFIQLSTRDYGFSRFLEGTSTALRTANVCKQLQELCVTATVAAMGDAGADEIFDAPTTDQAKKKAKMDAIEKKRFGGMPSTVDVKLNDDSTLKMIASLDARCNPFIELSATALETLKSHVHDDHPVAESGFHVSVLP